MANILNFYEADGRTLLEVQYRGGVPLPLTKVNLTFNDQGGSGVSEYVVRNFSSNANAKKVLITASQVPLDPDDGGTLVQEWSYQNPGTEQWTTYGPSVTVPQIDPGQAVRIRTKVSAAPNSNPTTHRGGISISYLRSSI